MEPGEVERRNVKPRAIDAEKTLRQKMGVDGDAIAESKARTRKEPRKDAVQAGTEEGGRSSR